MSKNITCFRCKRKMSHVGTEQIQLGKTGWIFGDWSNLLAGAMCVDIYCCPKCKKMEFFLADDNFLEKHSGEAEEDAPQKQCPNCGEWHDFDCPKCPSCKYDYYEE